MGNNPLTYTDKSGEYADTLVDSWVGIGGYWYGYATDDEIMMQVGEEMLKDTLKGALNPVKKIKKIKKGFDEGKKIFKLNNKSLEINKKIKSLKKGIKSYENEIQIHLNKIKNLKNGTYKIDMNKIKGDYEKDKQGLINKWNTEVKAFKKGVNDNKENIKKLTE